MRNSITKFRINLFGRCQFQILFFAILEFYNLQKYGWDSIVSSPVLDETIAPKTPEQLRIDSLKANKKRAADALAAERQRQQIAKAQKTLSAVHRITPKLPA